ncbi:holo-ACP synthase [Williamsia sterculiae]|uniref:Holo-[acyl-carrier-protein] synthase n=1 Tax=Williamsia sterculiae TaxID=1344003 RepID=A0A1N7CJ33_9NOCA|nr:holo-ACP synthase [Williamsia sterculiae]SIR63424.1 holo-[acyl-carrier protein] synthase [Williamsia sterculiae]
MSDPVADHLTGTRTVIGCDLVALDDIRASLDDFGERFLRRVFTDGEIAAVDGDARIERLAARFAAKEAVIKALAVADDPTPLVEIEVVGAGGPPQIRLHGSMAALAAEQGWSDPQVSLSHTSCHAMAMIAATVTDVR